MEHFKIQNLSFRYPQSARQALDHVELGIEQGEYITVCGRSGSGKSTLLLQLKSALAPYGEIEGDILFRGKPLKEWDLRTQSSEIGFVMQNPDDQIVTDKVWHELAFGLENLGTDQKTIRLRVAEMANYFGIEGWFHRSVSELSGGQKQLLNLASVMAMQPSVIILDEPTSQLDPIAAADFLNTVKKINLELGTTVIITEHRLENIFHCSDRVVVMENGAVVACDKPERIGALLREQHCDIFYALPSPVQIFYGVQDSGFCPLTVREGRSWLTQRYENRPVTVDHVEEEELPDDREIAVELREVWFRYEKEGRDILRGLSLKVPKGQLFAVVGGNGAGKSTMLKTICGINTPYSGKVLLDGKELKKYKKGELFRGNLAMLPQDPRSLFVCKTVEEDLMEMLDEGISEEEKKARIAQAVQDTECEGFLQTHPFDLSGGEQQRAALAKVLLTDPKILLLDEPTKGIDGFLKEKLAQVLKRLTAQGVTIVMVSHDVEFCAKYADSISMFFDSSILTTTTPRKFFSGNSFYTTAANRMSRHLFQNAITNEDVIKLCQIN